MNLTGIKVVKKLKLSKRELQIIKLIAKGMSSKIIAHELGLSSHTIRKYRENLMRKTKTHSAVGVTLFAFREGIVECPCKCKHD